MFKGILRRFRRSRPTHDWGQCSSGRYLYEFRQETEALAKVLSERNKPVSVVYVHKHEHAELRQPDGEVLLALTVHGSMCLADTVYIWPSAMGDYARQACLRAFAALNVRFTERQHVPGFAA